MLRALKQNKRKWIVTVFVALLFLQIFPLFTATAKGDVQYYEKWPDYEAANNIQNVTWNNVADAMDQVLDAAIEAYEKGDSKAAYDRINNAYYGYYEITGFERVAMGYIPGGRKSQMELQFSNCKSVAKKNGSLEDFKKEVETLRSMLHEDADILDGTTPEDSGSTATDGNRSAGAATFIACFTIILREGFEAILVVGAIVAYLVKAKGEKNDRIRKKMVRPVYIGAILGIAASFLSAFILNQLKLANSASQEIIEGVTALIAVAVLYWVSNWMLSKSESEAWSSYIRNKVEKSSRNGSVFALAFTAFLAVYREGAEVILFFQPMIAGGNLNMVWGGFILGCVALVFVFLAIRFLSIKIPLKPFFIATSILMFVMAFAFLGSGIKELIEGDVITATMPAWLSWIPMGSEGIASFLDILGIYPIVETFIPQMILVAVTIIIFIWHMKRNKRLKEAAGVAPPAEQGTA